MARVEFPSRRLSSGKRRRKIPSGYECARPWQMLKKTIRLRYKQPVVTCDSTRLDITLHRRQWTQRDVYIFGGEYEISTIFAAHSLTRVEYNTRTTYEILANNFPSSIHEEMYVLFFSFAFRQLFVVGHLGPHIWPHFYTGCRPYVLSEKSKFVARINIPSSNVDLYLLYRFAFNIRSRCR